MEAFQYLGDDRSPRRDVLALGFRLEGIKVLDDSQTKPGTIGQYVNKTQLE